MPASTASTASTSLRRGRWARRGCASCGKSSSRSSRRGLISAFIFAFIISFGDVYIALFLSGPGMTTLPIEIFSYMQWESTPVIAAITTIQIVMIMILGLVIERLFGLRRIMRI